MNTGWNLSNFNNSLALIINLLGNEYWLELIQPCALKAKHYKPTGK